MLLISSSWCNDALRLERTNSQILLLKTASFVCHESAHGCYPAKNLRCHIIFMILFTVLIASVITASCYFQFSIPSLAQHIGTNASQFSNSALSCLSIVHVWKLNLPIHIVDVDYIHFGRKSDRPNPRIPNKEAVSATEKELSATLTTVFYDIIARSDSSLCSI